MSGPGMFAHRRGALIRPPIIRGPVNPSAPQAHHLNTNMAADTETRELEPLYAQRYEPEHVAHALATLAMCGGNCRQARERLLAAGIDVNERTLLYWKNDRFPERYRQACHDTAPQIEAQVVDFQRELAYRASQAAQNAVALELERIEAREVKDASASARNLATTAGIAVDKVLSLTGRPTQITEHRTPEQSLKRLGQLVPGLIVDSTADEMPNDTPELAASS